MPRTHESPQPRWVGGSRGMVVRLRPTLPHRLQCSTIGAERLSFRVRNGTGRFPFAITAVTLWKYVPPTLSPLWVLRCSGVVLTVSRELHSGRETVLLLTHPPGVCVVSSYRLISTSQLHALLHFHIWPINPVVYWEPLRAKPHGNLILRHASRLDAFSGYHSRT